LVKIFFIKTRETIDTKNTEDKYTGRLRNTGTKRKSRFASKLNQQMIPHLLSTQISKRLQIKIMFSCLTGKVSRHFQKTQNDAATKKINHKRHLRYNIVNQKP
jgi:hypothetical protein